MSFSRNIFLFSSACLLAVVLLFPRYQRPGTEATLAWDVSGYYLYLPAIFIYHDLKEVKFLPQIIEKYQPSYAPDQAFPVENGHQVMKYSAGMALLYLPFFCIGHAIASLGGYPMDGFSLPYQAAIQLGGVLAAIFGLWFLRKNLLHFFSDRVTGWILLLIALGTNFFNYATFDAANPHVWLFALLALLVHATIRWHQRPNYRDGLVIGLSMGLAALVRPTELLFALVPLLWGIGHWSQLRPKLRLVGQHLPQCLLAVATVAAIGSLQLFYWKYVSGHWVVYSYQDQGFSFLHPHFVDVFFSYRKGWLLYTPLMAFAIAGLLLPIRLPNSPLPAAPPDGGTSMRPLLLLFFLLNAWVVCAWDIWWYGGAFGQRAMIQSYPLWALPLAALLTWLSRKKRAAWALGALMAGCLLLNLFQTYQAHWGPFETDMMNRAYYWRIFAKTKNDPYDRLLIDTKEGFSGKRENRRPIYATDFETLPDTTGTNTLQAHSGLRAAVVDSSAEYSHTIDLPLPAGLKPGQWLHVSAWFYGNQQEWDTWWMPQLVLRFEHQGQPVRERSVRPFRVLPPGQWGEVGMDIKIPNKPFDNIKVFAWNPAKRVPMWMDDLQLETFD